MDHHYLAHHYSSAHHHNASVSIIIALLSVVWLIARAIRGINGIKRGGLRNERTGATVSPSLTGWILSVFTLLKKPDAALQARQTESQARQAEIVAAIRNNKIPESMRRRLDACRSGASPWIATLSPAELLMNRSHGIRPIAAVSATCWMYYGYSWTNGHAQGWGAALQRLKDEARAAGANAVVDVKMRTIPLDAGDSMDFSLIGTAVKIEGLAPSADPVVATVPALEFVRLLEANIVPTGIAVGADFQWMSDWRRGTNLFWAGNTECTVLSDLWQRVRQRAHNQLRNNALAQGNGALAHVNFSQMLEQEADPKQYLARHIVIATTVETHETFTPGMRKLLGAAETMPFNFQMVVDMHAGKTPLTRTVQHHQSYANNEEEGAI